MDTCEVIKDIKGQFRLYMNGAASKSMREKGLGYKINWGIELPRLKEIASKYEKNHAVAQELWKENIRECKILAGLLQPVDTFCEQLADNWAEEMPNPEIAQLTCLNLFQYLPYASQKAFQWMADEREYVELCGFSLIARLLMKGNKLKERAQEEFLDQALAALEEDKLLIRQAVANALRKYGEQGEENRKRLIGLLIPLSNSENPEVKAVTDEIKSDMEYSF